MRAAIVRALVLSLVASGCGAKFDLPNQSPAGNTIPSDQSYQMLSTWHDLDGLQDVLLTQGPGTQLFLLFNTGGDGTDPRGYVMDVALTRYVDLGHRFNTVFNPFAMCSGGDGRSSPSNRIYVLDRGDTCLAKINPRTGLCDTTGVTNLALYWRAREYGLLGGDTLSTLTDLSFAFVSGIAADAEGSVYVAGAAVVFQVDPNNPLLRHRVFQSKIYKYRRGPRYPGVISPDRLPGANWHRDSTYEVAEGQGIGYVSNPRGMQWSGVGIPGLWVANAGSNSSVDKVDDEISNTGFFRIEEDGANHPILTPADVAADLAGFSYVCDTGNQQVLRYGPGGIFIQRVDVEADDDGARVLEPVAVAADDSLVYVADRGRSEIVRYQRRK